jgi:8-oxo-dGTP pyrophosphatase MutT (NUDIX family)
MDLQIQIEDTLLYIRVAVLIQNKNGYIFEKGKKGYDFTVGGKVKINETSVEAAKREIEEEIGLKLSNFKLVGIIENFYTDKGGINVHEICYVQKVKEIVDFTCDEINFTEVNRKNIENKIILPTAIVDFIKNDNEEFKHIILK